MVAELFMDSERDSKRSRIGSPPPAALSSHDGEEAPPSASGRIQMACPTAPRASVARLSQRNKNKHRRLFDGEALKDGEQVSYNAHGVKLLTGTVVINPSGVSGIRCDHCNTVISCSAFESHAGHGQRRNPYGGWVDDWLEAPPFRFRV